MCHEAKTTLQEGGDSTPTSGILLIHFSRELENKMYYAKIILTKEIKKSRKYAYYTSNSFLLSNIEVQ